MSIPQCIILEIPDTLSIYDYDCVFLEILMKKMQCGNVVNMPYLEKAVGLPTNTCNSYQILLLRMKGYKDDSVLLMFTSLFLL